MAVFRPSQKVCELNFDDTHYFNLPLHEDTADAIDKAVNKLGKLAPKDRAGIDEAYNAALDIIDELLGDGAAENIMSLYDKPGTLEVWNVLYYILDEWKTAYSAELDKIKSTTATPNRAERRARR
jgi:hypothetical protein